MYVSYSMIVVKPAGGEIGVRLAQNTGEKGDMHQLCKKVVLFVV